MLKRIIHEAEQVPELAMRMLAAILLTVCVANPGRTETPSPDQYEMFPDEAAAVAAYNANPGSKELLRRVSDIRFEHAVRLINEHLATTNPPAFERAVEYLDAIAEVEPAHTRSRLLLGALTLEAALNGAPSGGLCVDHFIAVLKAEPDNGAARQLLAATYLMQGRYEKSLEHFEQLLKSDASFISGATVLAMCRAYVRDGQVPRGVGFLQTLTARHPQKKVVQVGLALLLAAAGDHNRAAARFRTVAEDGTATPEERALGGDLLRRLLQEGARR